jgi:hypothetical protein
MLVGTLRQGELLHRRHRLLLKGLVANYVASLSDSVERLIKAMIRIDRSRLGPS